MKKHSNWKWWLIVICFTVVILIVVITYFYFTNRLEFLFKSEWKTLWTSFKIWEKVTLLFGAFIYPVFVNWFSDLFYNRVFPSDTKVIIGEVEKAKKELLIAIQANAAKQGLNITVDELIQENKELREKLKKHTIVSINPKLQNKLDKLFAEFQYEEFRNTIDEFINENENIKQKELAKLYYQKALTYEAELNYSKSKEELETAVVLDRSNINILHLYSVTLHTLGEYDVAIDHYRKALKIDLKYFGNAHPNVVANYNNLGLAWYSKGDYNKALKYCEEALKIDLKIFGAKHRKVANDYSNIGLICNSKGEYNKAIEYYKKALKIDLNVFGDEHPKVANDYHNIGLAWYAKGEHNKAKACYEKANKIVSKDLSPGPIYVRSPLDVIMGQGYFKDEFIEDSEYSEKSFKIYHRFFPGRPPHILIFPTNIRKHVYIAKKHKDEGWILKSQF